MKTKITMLNGDQHILEGHPEDYMNKIQNGLGVITVDTIEIGQGKTIDTYDIMTFEKVAE